MDTLPVVFAQADAPFSLRFIVQPVLAILLGLRDGRRDAVAGRPPYALSIFTGQLDRRAALKEALRAVAVPLVIAIVLDAVVQVLVRERILVSRAVVVGILLVGVPYILSRGLTNRALMFWWQRRERVS